MIIDANSYWFDERIFHDETLCEQFWPRYPAPMTPKAI